MVRMEMTPNYTGVKISGTQEEFEAIVDAIYELVIDELSEDPHYYVVSNRILGMCYDIRHAFMGDREIEIVRDNTPEHLVDYRDLPVEQTSFIVSDNFLYPELCFVMMALDVVIDYRMRKLSKNRFMEHKDAQVRWDRTILLMRLFQSAFIDCMEKELTPNSFTRLRNLIDGGADRIKYMYGQYLDLKNLDFLEMTPQKRKASLSVVPKRLVEYQEDPEYHGLAEALRRGAAEHGVSPHELHFQNMDYPDVIEW